MNKKKLSLIIILLLAAAALLIIFSKKNAETGTTSTTANLPLITETQPVLTDTPSQTTHHTPAGSSSHITQPDSGEDTEASATDDTSGEPSSQETQTSPGALPQTDDTEADTPSADASSEADAAIPDENGFYYSKDDVALYIHTYGHLPDNFVTKKEAKAAGWNGGSIEDFFPGCVIGGDYFGNYEGLLPKKNGRSYYECDIDTLGKKSRGAKRIIFSNDGLIYYTDDHYESFTELFGGGAQ